MNAQSTQLALNDTCRQLAATQSFDEIKTIRDKAEAIRDRYLSESGELIARLEKLLS